LDTLFSDFNVEDNPKSDARREGAHIAVCGLDGSGSFNLSAGGCFVSGRMPRILLSLVTVLSEKCEEDRFGGLGYIGILAAGLPFPALA
jgi:hypothetical protein